MEQQLPSHEQQRTLEVIYAAFKETNTWPTYDYVDRTLFAAYQIDLDSVLSSLPPGLVGNPYASTHQPADPVFLLLPGLALVPDAAGDIDLFLRFVQWLVERDRTLQPPSPGATGSLEVNSEEYLQAELATGRNVSEPELIRQGKIIEKEPGLWTSYSFDDPPGRPWRMRVDRRVRRFQGVNTIQEYLAKRDEVSPRQRAEAALIDRLLSGPDGFTISTSSPQPRFRQQAIDTYIFVLMPFDPKFDPVYGMIQDVCVQLQLPALRCERADEISKPGRITDHITEAIHSADVLVADMTGNNPNVMFELGYADALNKQIIVLNQDVNSSPFDLQNWRQIVYNPQSLIGTRSTLARFLRNVLGLA